MYNNSICLQKVESLQKVMAGFFQGGVHYIHVKWPQLVMINVGHDSNLIKILT